MMKSPFLTRRAALAVGASLPLASLPFTGARAGLSVKKDAVVDNSAPFSVQREAAPSPLHNTFSIGDFTVSTLLAGTRAVPDPHTIFGLNVDEAAFTEVSHNAFLPTDAAQFFFTPTLVRSGDQLVLFDTGTDPNGIRAALHAAGYGAEDVTTVVITHMHGDHIGGLMEGDTPTFPNAVYVTGQMEYDHWSTADNDGFKAKVAPLTDKISFIKDGDSPLSGITAVSAFGHTPGHMAYHLESGSERLLLIADTANHPVWSLERPDWEVRFDMDKPAAAQARQKVLGMVAADRIPMVGYHMPFPAVGYVESRGDGFGYVPVSYQMMLKPSDK